MELKWVQVLEQGNGDIHDLVEFPLATFHW